MAKTEEAFKPQRELMWRKHCVVFRIERRESKPARVKCPCLHFIDFFTYWFQRMNCLPEKKRLTGKQKPRRPGLQGREGILSEISQALPSFMVSPRARSRALILLLESWREIDLWACQSLLLSPPRRSQQEGERARGLLLDLPEPWVPVWASLCLMHPCFANT